MRTAGFFICLLLFTSQIYSQWSTEWQSTNVSSNYVSGWLNFIETGDKWESKFYIIDDTKFQVMSGGYSSSPVYTYQFTQEEILAGYQLYSFGKDLTGDNITEFYVLGYHGSTETYRQSVKIFDVVTGDVLLELDDDSYYYTYPVVWDIDDDGTLECSLARYDYPNFEEYVYLVYNTGVTTSLGKSQIPVQFELMQNYPNPFNPVTTIQYLIGQTSNVRVDVYDVKGELIKSLDNGIQHPGKHTVEWDATNQYGQKVSSGIYFYSVRTDFQTQTKKMILVK